MLLAALNLTSKFISIFFIGAMPFLEIKGAIVSAFAMKLNFNLAFLIGYLGSTLPAILLIPLFLPITEYLEKKNLFKKITAKLRFKVSVKTEEAKNRKFKLFMLFAFVVLPLPFTGVYSASAVASFMKLPYKGSLMAIALGNLVSGLIVSGLTYGIF